MVILRGYGLLEPLAPWPVDLDARSPRDAIHGLSSQLPELRRAIVDGRWHVIRDGECLDLDMLDLPAGSEIHIVPEAYGESGGNTATFAMIGIGIVLVGASILIPGSGTLAAAGYSSAAISAAGAAGPMAFGLGVSLALTGVAQLLSPDPSAKDEGSSGSTLMGGQVNTTSVDTVVPVAFGRIMVGSVVTSAGQTTVQLI